MTSTKNLWFWFACMLIGLCWLNQSVLHCRLSLGKLEWWILCGSESYLCTFIAFLDLYSVLDEAGLAKVLEDMWNKGWKRILKSGNSPNIGLGYCYRYLIFWFGKSSEYEYEYIRFWKNNRIRIRILFGLKKSSEYEYEN